MGTALELAMVIGAIVFMARVADVEDRSGFAWGSLTLLLCMASGLIPLPFIRIAIACAISFVAMIVVKAVKG